MGTIEPIYCLLLFSRLWRRANDRNICPTTTPRRVLPNKRLLGMYLWMSMGSHFHNWIDYNRLTFLVELLEWDFCGMKILVSRDLKIGRLTQKLTQVRPPPPPRGATNIEAKNISYHLPLIKTCYQKKESFTNLVFQHCQYPSLLFTRPSSILYKRLSSVPFLNFL